MISLTATSWDDSNPRLHTNERTEKNLQYKSFLMSALESTASELISIGVDQSPYASVLVTTAQILQKAYEDSRVYTSVALPAGAMDVKWTADRTVRFWYVRSNGSGNGYGLYCIEDKLEMDCLYSASANYKQEDGSVDTKIIANSQADVVLESDGYGDMTRPCDACRNNQFRGYAVGDIIFIFAGETVIADGMDLPRDPCMI